MGNSIPTARFCGGRFSREETPMKNIPAVFIVFLVIFGASLAGAAPSPSHLDTHHAALQALQAGNTLEAIDLFTQAIAVAPKDFRYYNDRGVAYRKCGDLKRALEDYTTALELNPKYTNALNNRGVVHLQQGDYDKALKDFTEALKHGGLEGTILTNLGRVYALQGDHASAMREFEKALSHSPIDNRAFLFMAESFEKTGEKDRALKMYELALGLIKEPNTAQYIEGRIAALDKVRSSPQSRPQLASTSVNRPVEQQTAGVNHPSRETAQAQRQTRQILPARAVQTPVSVPKKEMPAPRESGVKTVQELDLLCRNRVLEKFSPVSAEIYKQGIQFLEKSDRAKALVRFEDARQLEKRKKNLHGVAWNSLEAGRVYGRMGEHLKATGVLDEALKTFERLKAADETVLASLELALNQKAAGRKDKADAYYKMAIEQAASSGHKLLAVAIGDMAAGKAPVAEQQAPVEHEPKQTAPPAPQMAARPSAPQQEPPEMKPVLAPPPTSGSPKHAQTQATQPGIQIDGLAKVGQGPVAWGETGKSRRPVRPVTPALPAGSVIPSKPIAAGKMQVETPVASGSKAGSSPTAQVLDKTPGVSSPAAAKHPVARQPVPQPVRPVTVAKVPSSPNIPEIPQTKPVQPAKDKRSAARKRADERQIQQDLSQLIKLRQTEDEQHMVPILERLAEKYIKSGDYERALHCVLASAGFREKYLIAAGTDKVVAQRGLLRQRLGRPVEALEDFTQASVLSDRRTRGVPKGPGRACA